MCVCVRLFDGCNWRHPVIPDYPDPDPDPDPDQDSEDTADNTSYATVSTYDDDTEDIEQKPPLR